MLVVESWKIGTPKSLKSLCWSWTKATKKHVEIILHSLSLFKAQTIAIHKDAPFLEDSLGGTCPLTLSTASISPFSRCPCLLFLFLLLGLSRKFPFTLTLIHGVTRWARDCNSKQGRQDICIGECFGTNSFCWKASYSTTPSYCRLYLTCQEVADKWVVIRKIEHRIHELQELIEGNLMIRLTTL